MKKFIIFLIIIILSGSASLILFFRFSSLQISYHIIMMSSVILIVYLINFVWFLLTANKKLRIGIHLFNFLAVLVLVLFYLAVAGSNSLWGRPISASLLVSYLASINDFIAVLPVKAYLIYGAITLAILILAFIYFYTAPSRHYNPRQSRTWQIFNHLPFRKKILVTCTIALLIVATTPLLLKYKRLIHFRGEPAMEFLFGQMWESGGEDFVFGKEMAVKGMNEKPCIDAIQPELEKKTGRVTVVILFDGLRSDFLPAYGYSRKTTPFLDSLQQSGNMTVVRNAFSTSTTTLVGVAGLFGSKDWNTFSFTGLNLMKFLKIKGYSTYAFLTGQHRSWYGLTNIYKNDCDFFYESTTRPTEQNFDDFTTLKKFEETSITPNSFVYIHLLSTHTIGSKEDSFRKFMPDKLGLTGNKKEVLINNYDNGIIQGDFIVNRIFDKLKKDGLLDYSTIYILSDHGELFGEDGRWSHSGSIHPDLLKVPLMIYDQQPAWYINKQSATLKDVAPSIADRLGYAIPECWEGYSLGKNPNNFSVQLHSGSDCDFPQGTLTRKDSSFYLEILNRDLKPAMHFHKSIGEKEWQKN